MRKSFALVFALFAAGCLSLTPQGSKVDVYKASLDGPPAGRAMPDGCKKIADLGKDRFSEQMIEGQSDPYRRQRNEAGGGGGNILLVLMHETSARANPECPNGVPIGSCPGVSGAWYEVTFENYTCTPEAVKTLQAQKPKMPSE